MNSRLLLNRSTLSCFNRFRRLGSFRTYTSQGYNKDRRVMEVTKPSDSRHWSNYIAPTALLMIVGGAALLRYNDERRAIMRGCGERSPIKGPAIGGPFKLIDTDYNVVTDNDLKGNWVLMYFGYTSSPDVGPEEVKKMAKAIDILEAEQNLKIKPVFISIDPERDSPSQLRAYLKEFDSRIIGLTGSISAVRQTAQEYRIYFRKVEEDGEDYLVESSHNMYLMNPNMELVRCFGVEYDAEQLCEAILKEVKRVPDNS